MECSPSVRRTLPSAGMTGTSELATWKTGCRGLEPSHKSRHAPAVSDVGVGRSAASVTLRPRMPRLAARRLSLSGFSAPDSFG